MEVFNVHFRSHEPVCSLFNQPAQGSFKSDIVQVYLSPLVLSLKMERGGDWRYMQMRQLVLAKNELSGTVPPCPLLPKHWDRSTTPFVLGMDNSCWHWVLLHNWSALWDLRKSFVHPTSPFFLAKKFSVLKIVEIFPLKKLMIESVKVSEDRTSWHKKQDQGGNWICLKCLRCTWKWVLGLWGFVWINLTVKFIIVIYEPGSICLKN